jgi:TonB family protein
MSETAPLTFREAVLGSLLLHALIFIFVLLFPGVFTWHAAPTPRAGPDESIPVAFLSEPPPDPPEIALGDSGEGLQSDPRPADAPPPRNADPYARGNTPNRFVAPPVSGPASPEPGSPRQDEPLPSPPPASGPSGQTAENDAPSGDEAQATEGQEGFHVSPPEGGRPGSGSGPGARTGGRGSIKEALGRMSMGHGGAGEPLRYDNPVGGLSGPTGGLSFDTAGFDWGPYARRIYWIIWTNWTRGWPPAARAGLSGVVTVRFRIHRNGSISSIVVMKESGTPAFDTCATLALEASSPLPPLPDDFPKDSEGITARFLYNMSAGEAEGPPD